VKRAVVIHLVVAIFLSGVGCGERVRNVPELSVLLGRCLVLTRDLQRAETLGDSGPRYYLSGADNYLGPLVPAGSIFTITRVAYRRGFGNSSVRIIGVGTVPDEIDLSLLFESHWRSDVLDALIHGEKIPTDARLSAGEARWCPVESSLVFRETRSLFAIPLEDSARPQATRPRQ
jgi:hypothetical protein